MSEDTDWAWVAGLIEGEGCITVPGKGRNYCRLQMESTDHDVLLRLQAIAGGTISGPAKRHSNWKPIWHWGLAKNVLVKDAVEHILPYLGERRRAKALVVLEHFEGKERLTAP